MRKPWEKRRLKLWFKTGLILFLIGIFLKLTFEVNIEGGSGDPEFARADAAILFFVTSLRNPAYAALAVDITALGSPAVLTILSTVIGALAWLLRDWISLYQIALGSIGAGILTTALKSLFGRQRPNMVPSLIEVNGFSYPSGHSLAASAIYFTVAILAFRYFKSFHQRVVLFGLTAAIVLLIGFSRIYLGVHYPSDVAAGICLGAAWAFILGAGIEILRGRSPDSREAAHV